MTKIGDTLAKALGADRVSEDADSLKAGESTEYVIGKQRRGYLVPAIGEVEIEGVRLQARDGAAIADVERFRVTALSDTELVLVDSAA